MPGTVQATLENPEISTFTPGIAAPDVSQWAINLMATPELLRRFHANRARPERRATFF